MTIRTAPANHPYAAVEVFDALMRVLPHSDLQVVWADRGLGIITALAGDFGTRTDHATYTFTLQPTGPAASVLLVQANRHGNYERRWAKVPFEVSDRVVAQAMVTLDLQDRRRAAGG